MTQKDEETDEIIANASGVIWYKSFLFIKKKLGKLTDAILADGSEVKIKVNLDFHEKYGLKLVIVDIDPSHTLGLHELSKQKIIERLNSENAIDQNEKIKLPVVLQRVAIISSETAAGYLDFINQLEHNQYQYGFEFTLLSSAVQGTNMEREIVASLKYIQKHHKQFDIVVIIRGGGSKLDLSGFDNYKIAKAISELKIPVITGIGHEIDQTITDLVSHTSVKTPTAAANFIIDKNLDFESNILATWEQINTISQRKIVSSKEHLNYIKVNLNNLAAKRASDARHQLETLFTSIKSQLKSLLNEQQLRLEYSQKILANANATDILKRGFVILRQDNKIVTRKSKFKNLKPSSIEFYDGNIKINESNE